jgi:hypothetical protein
LWLGRRERPAILARLRWSNVIDLRSHVIDLRSHVLLRHSGERLARGIDEFRC